MATAVKQKKKQKKQIPLIADNPLRPRDWRWRRVQYLSEKAPGQSKRPKTTDLDDDYIKEARNYMVARATLNDDLVNIPGKDEDLALANLRSKYGCIMDAEKLYTSKSTKRWAVEALVLAQVPPEDIAAGFGCDPEIIAAYEIYFYDVRSRLQNELYIVDELLAPAMKEAPHGDDQDFFWKSLAYCHGAPILRAMMSYGKIPEEMQDQLVEFTASMQRRNVAKASIARQINQYNAHEIMEEDLAGKQVESDKELSSAAEQMANGADMLMQAVGFAVASAANIGTGGVERRVGSSIKELASGDKSGNNDSKTIDVPDGILAARDEKRRQDEVKAEASVGESRNTVPESKPKARPRQPVVTPIANPEGDDDINDRIDKKKAAAIARLKSKAKRGKK